MKCYKHPEQDAVGQCMSCNRGLCHHCSSRFDMQLCESCLIANNNAVKNSILKNFAKATGFSILLSIFFITFAGKQESKTGIFIFSFFVFFLGYYGMKFIDRFISNGLGVIATPGTFFLLNGIVIWIKFMIGLVLGFVLGPINIYQSIRELKKISQTSRMLRTGEI